MDCVCQALFSVDSQPTGKHTQLVPNGPSFGESVLERVEPAVNTPKPHKARAEQDRSPIKPREARALKALASGEAKSVSAALRIAGFNESSRQIRDRLSPGGALSQILADEMEELGLGRKVTLCNLLKHLDSKKIQTIAGEAHTSDDNEAQLRAIENVIKLQERAGMIPSAKEESSCGTNIQVNIISYK